MNREKEIPGLNIVDQADLGIGYGADQIPPEFYDPGKVNPNFQAPSLNPVTDLMELRYEFPFLPIMPFPASLSTVVLAANTAQDLPIIDGATVAMFFGSGDFYLSKLGNAEVPSSVNVANAQSIYKPTGFLWYVRGLRSVSVIAPNADTVVQALCYITKNWQKDNS
jgi:hypothetical protein